MDLVFFFKKTKSTCAYPRLGWPYVASSGDESDRPWPTTAWLDRPKLVVQKQTTIFLKKIFFLFLI